MNLRSHHLKIQSPLVEMPATNIGMVMSFPQGTYLSQPSIFEFMSKLPRGFLALAKLNHRSNRHILSTNSREGDPFYCFHGTCA